MPTTTSKTASKTKMNPILPSRVKMEQEAMIMRETDQWMTEHYKKRA